MRGFALKMLFYGLIRYYRNYKFMIVSKFGGTSVGSYDAMQHSAQIVASNPARRLIVISAVSGITNALVTLSSPWLEAGEKEELIRKIEEKHTAIIKRLKDNTQTFERFGKLMAELRKHLDFIGRDRLWKDTLLAFGELMSTTIFHQVLAEQGVDAHLLDARTIIKTDSEFGRAEPDIAAIAKKAAGLLSKDKVYLTQGFIGSDIFGNTTTLGRGGSDYTAALFAEALNAGALEIWTDVAGVYTCDPRLVENARPIPQISFDEAAELSVFGGKVLHPATLKPAVRAGALVKVLSSKNPEEAGTTIVSKAETEPIVRAISLRRDQTLLTVRSLKMLHQHGFLAQLFQTLTAHKISVDLVTTSEVSVSLTLDTASNAATKVEITPAVLADLEKFCEVQTEHNLALVALIGNNLNKTKGVSGNLFVRLRDYNIRVICHGSSPNNLCFLVQEEEAGEIVKSLHKIFIEDA